MSVGRPKAPITTVRITCGKLLLEVMKRPEDSVLGAWTRQVAIDLVSEADSKDPFCREVMNEARTYRDAEAERKRIARGLPKHDDPQEHAPQDAANPQDEQIGKAEDVAGHNEKVKARFTAPTLEEVRQDFMGDTQADAFFDFYSSKGWKVGRVPMKDWKAAARNWRRNQKNFMKQGGSVNGYKNQFDKMSELGDAVRAARAAGTNPIQP